MIFTSVTSSEIFYYLSVLFSVCLVFFSKINAVMTNPQCPGAATAHFSFSFRYTYFIFIFRVGQFGKGEWLMMRRMHWANNVCCPIHMCASGGKLFWSMFRAFIQWQREMTLIEANFSSRAKTSPILSTVSIEYRLVTDTDRRRHRAIASTRISIASCG